MLTVIANLLLYFDVSAENIVRIPSLYFPKIIAKIFKNPTCTDMR